MDGAASVVRLVDVGCGIYCFVFRFALPCFNTCRLDAYNSRILPPMGKKVDIGGSPFVLCSLRRLAHFDQPGRTD